MTATDLHLGTAWPAPSINGKFYAQPEQSLRDWQSAATLTPSFEAFAAIDIPITLVRGGETPDPIIDVTEQLTTNIPHACERVVPGADHFLISTHPAACAEIIESHIFDVSR